MTKRTVSAVWYYFSVVHGREDIAKCNICNAEIRRGAVGSKLKSYSTKSLWGHLKARHPDEHSLADDARSKQEDETQKKKTKREGNAEFYTLSSPPTALSTSSTNQRSLGEILMHTKKYEPSHNPQMEGEQHLLYWLCDDLQPCQTVENQCFLRFIESQCKGFKVPSTKTIRTKLIPELNAKVQYNVKKALDDNKNGFYSITSDIWTSPTHDSFMSITLHFITEDFERKVVVLRCVRYDVSHTAINLANTLRGICNDWGIHNVQAIVRDNTSNIVQGLKLAGYESIGCFCHILHLVVKHSVMEQNEVKILISKVRSLVKKLQRPKSKEIFHAYQGTAGVPKNVMILDCETQWSSMHQMCEQALEQKQAIQLAEDDPELHISASAKMTPKDWELIPKVLAILKPLAYATKFAESDSASVSDIIPLTKRLIMEIASVYESGVGTMKKEVLENISRYLRGEDSQAHFVDVEDLHLTAIATLLDPRYKTAAFMKKEKAKRGKLKLLSLIIVEMNKKNEQETSEVYVEPLYNPQMASTETSETTATTGLEPVVNIFTGWDWDAFLNSDSEDSPDSKGLSLNITKAATMELNKYMKMKRIHIDTDPLVFWRSNSSQLPTLSLLARKYLSPPPSLTANEIKIGKNSQNDRVQLLPNNVETLLFLKYNLRSISYRTSLPCVPPNFVPPNGISNDNTEILDEDVDHDILTDVVTHNDSESDEEWLPLHDFQDHHTLSENL